MAQKGKIIQVNKYNPLYQNKDGYTVAMILVASGIIPPREWMHNYTIMNKYGHTLK